MTKDHLVLLIDARAKLDLAYHALREASTNLRQIYDEDRPAMCDLVTQAFGRVSCVLHADQGSIHAAIRSELELLERKESDAT